MAKIGSDIIPVYVDSNGDAKACSRSLFDISVVNKGDYNTIAEITIDGGTPILIKNFNQVTEAFAVSFVDWDIKLLKSESVLKGGNATPPENPTREGYIFKAWDGTYTNVQANSIVTATYDEVKMYTVTFVDGFGTTLKTVTGVKNGTYLKDVEHPADPTHDQTQQYTFSFTGWDVSETSQITSDTTVTAQWDLVLRKYTVTFNDYDGTKVKDVSVDYGTNFISMETPTPTREGYNFSHWIPPDNLNSNYEVIADCVTTPFYTKK